MWAPPKGHLEGRLGLATDSRQLQILLPAPAWERNAQDQRVRSVRSPATLSAFLAARHRPRTVRGFTIPSEH